MKTTIKFAGYQGEQSVHTRAANHFCEVLRHSVGAAIDIQFEPNIVRHGFKAADLLTKTESGELDGCYFSSSYLVGRVPELGLFDQHFAVPMGHMHRKPVGPHPCWSCQLTIPRRLAGEVIPWLMATRPRWRKPQLGLRRGRPCRFCSVWRMPSLDAPIRHRMLCKRPCPNVCCP